MCPLRTYLKSRCTVRSSLAMHPSLKSLPVVTVSSTPPLEAKSRPESKLLITKRGRKNSSLKWSGKRIGRESVSEKLRRCKSWWRKQLQTSLRGMESSQLHRMQGAHQHQSALKEVLVRPLAMEMSSLTTYVTSKMSHKSS